MDRRTFLASLTSLLATPLAAGAQQAPKIPKIGLLTLSTAAAATPLVEAFRQGLRELGYIEGKTITLEQRFADENFDQLPYLAKELVAAPVDIIVAQGTPASVNGTWSLPRPGSSCTVILPA